MKLFILSLILSIVHARSILDYGVVNGTNVHVDDEFKNARALERAVEDASNDTTDREVVIPEGIVLSMMPMYFKYLNDISIRIEGTIL